MPPHHSRSRYTLNNAFLINRSHHHHHRSRSDSRRRHEKHHHDRKHSHTHSHKKHDQHHHKSSHYNDSHSHQHHRHHHHHSESDSRSGSSESRDDSIGHYKGKLGSILGEKYRIISLAGTGTFGKVFTCEPINPSSDSPVIVAIKVIRDVTKYTEEAKVEKDVWNRILSQEGSNEAHIVKLYNTFMHGPHYCIVMESLGQSVYDVLKLNDYTPFPLDTVKTIGKQLLESLNFMHNNELVHTDLKLENILFVDKKIHRREYKILGENTEYQKPICDDIKVIDFGGATFSDQAKSTIINTRQYRAPEVILELKWSYPSDIWSAGCILYELYKGSLLFATHDSSQHLSLIQKIIGPFPDAMVKITSTKYFDVDGDLKFLNEGSSHLRKEVERAKALEDLIEPDDSLFLDLLKKMLIINPDNRCTASDALDHPFFKS